MNVNDEQNPKMKTKINSSRSNSNSSNKEQRREEEPSLTLAFDPIVRGIVLDLDDLQDLVKTFPQRYRECMLSLSKIIKDGDRWDNDSLNGEQHMSDAPRLRPLPTTKLIDVLMNNAGGYPTREVTTKDQRSVRTEFSIVPFGIFFVNCTFIRRRFIKQQQLDSYLYQYE